MAGLEDIGRLTDKVVFGGSRKLAKNLPFRPHRLDLDAPTIAFSFDDYPASAGDNAAPVLEDAGMRGTFYLATGLMGDHENGQRITDPNMVRDLHRRGHEIGAHTHSHLNVQRHPYPDLARDIDRNVLEIEGLTGVAPTSFAYPFGVLSLVSKLRLMHRFAGLRSIMDGINSGIIDLACLRSQELCDRSSDATSIGALLDDAERRRGWLIFYTHDVKPDHTDIGTSTRYFAEIVDLVRRRGYRVETVAQTLARIGAAQPVALPA